MMSYVDTLKQISDKFDKLRFFKATKRVDSEAIFDRQLARVGDEIEVIRWFCDKGPTQIKINGIGTCVPFSWVMDMGANKELPIYMPFPEKTWAEIIAEEEAKEKKS